MSKWKIQHEEFQDKTPKGSIRKSMSDETREKLRESNWSNPETRLKSSETMKRNKSAKYRVLFHQIHKDKYDYSKVPEVFSVKEKITVICRLHGEFQVSPEKHVGKGKHLPKGCRQCRDGYKVFGNGNASIYHQRYDVLKVSELINKGLTTTKIAQEMKLRRHIVERIIKNCCSHEEKVTVKNSNRKAKVSGLKQ